MIMNEATLAAVLEMLSRGPCDLVLDPTDERVIVPSGHRGTSVLVLTIGYGLAVPIPDLTVNMDGVSGTLSFSRRPFYCYIPWSAVHHIIDNVIGLSDTGARPVSNSPTAETPAEIKARKRAHLKLVP